MIEGASWLHLRYVEYGNTFQQKPVRRPRRRLCRKRTRARACVRACGRLRACVRGRCTRSCPQIRLPHDCAHALTPPAGLSTQTERGVNPGVGPVDHLAWQQHALVRHLLNTQVTVSGVQPVLKPEWWRRRRVRGVCACVCVCVCVCACVCVTRHGSLPHLRVASAHTSPPTPRPLHRCYHPRQALILTRSLRPVERPRAGTAPTVCGLA